MAKGRALPLYRLELGASSCALAPAASEASAPPARSERRNSRRRWSWLEFMVCKEVDSTEFLDASSQHLDQLISGHAGHDLFLGGKVFHEDVVAQSPFRQRLAVGGNRHAGCAGFDTDFAVSADDARRLHELGQNGLPSRQRPQQLLTDQIFDFERGCAGRASGCWAKLEVRGPHDSAFV